MTHLRAFLEKEFTAIPQSLFLKHDDESQIHLEIIQNTDLNPHTWLRVAAIGAASLNPLRIAILQIEHRASGDVWTLIAYATRAVGCYSSETNPFEEHLLVTEVPRRKIENTGFFDNFDNALKEIRILRSGRIQSYSGAQRKVPPAGKISI